MENYGIGPPTNKAEALRALAMAMATMSASSCYIPVSEKLIATPSTIRPYRFGVNIITIGNGHLLQSKFVVVGNMPIDQTCSL